MLDQYGAEPFEQQQFGTAGVEGVIFPFRSWNGLANFWIRRNPCLYHEQA